MQRVADEDGNGEDDAAAMIDEEQRTAPQHQHRKVGSCDFTIVGIRYYGGVAHAGEYVRLVREPRNPYDRNAVRVDNLAGEKVGHVKREQAEILAPILDDANLGAEMEATIPHPGNKWNMPVTIEFYAVVPNGDDGDGDEAERIQSRVTLALNARFRNRYGFRGTGPAAPVATSTATTTSVTTTSRKLDWQTQAEELDTMFDKQLAEQLNDLPPLPDDIGFKDDVSLFDFQESGIRWLIHQETTTEQLRKLGNDYEHQQHRLPPFYKIRREAGKRVYFCDVTNSSHSVAPNPRAGSILADEMGLGKTIQTIGLILGNPSSAKRRQALLAATSSPGITAASSSSSLPTDECIAAATVVDLKGVLRKAGLLLGGKKRELMQRILQGASEEEGTVLASHFDPSFYPPPPPPPVVGTGGGDGGKNDDANDQNRTCTLIVCPVSVMANWNQQIQAHVRPGTLSVGFYQGANRSSMLPSIHSGAIDVLLVGYETLANEFANIYGNNENAAAPENKTRRKPPRKKTKRDSVFEVEFHRICLDEAHKIRSHKKRSFRAADAVDASHRLALTGTPFVNRVDDILSLLKFCRVEPLGDPAIFRRAVTNEIQNRSVEIGLSRLRTTMAHVALRRSKALANIRLVDKSVQLRSVTFPAGDHKVVYDALFGTFRVAMEALLSAGTREAAKNYNHVFEKLLRIRQACCSASLIPGERREAALELWSRLRNRSGERKLTPAEGKALLEKLKGTFSQQNVRDDAELPECAVCLMEMEMNDAVILRTCEHVFCKLCISRVSSGSTSRAVSCPLCRKPFGKEDMVQKSAAAIAASNEDTAGTKLKSTEETGFSTPPKILALLEAIKAMPENEKGVIFSQFTSFLDIIGKALEVSRHSFTRIDGSMNANDRMTAVRMFCSEEEDSPRFVLCSLHAAGTGINLTRGNHAFMMDCWWNQAVENQAMDRIHRIGQTRKVSIIRFVMKGSVEERMVKLQEAKNLQSKGSMEKLKAEEQRKARMSDLKGLLMLENEWDEAIES